MNASRTPLVVLLAIIAAVWMTDAAQIESTWNGSTNNWSDIASWNHSLPVSEYPNNGQHQFGVIVSNGEPTVDAPVTISDLFLNGGNLRIQQPISIAGSLIWAAGSAVWEGDWRDLSKMKMGGIQLTGIGSAIFNLPINASGYSLIDGPTNAQFFSLENAGLFELRGAGVISVSLLPGIINSGTLIKTGNGEWICKAGIVNSGSLEVRSGLLTVNETSDLRGNVHVDAGARLMVSEGDMGNAIFHGPGDATFHYVWGSNWILTNRLNCKATRSLRGCLISKDSSLEPVSDAYIDNVTNLGLMRLTGDLWGGTLQNAGTLRVEAIGSDVGLMVSKFVNSGRVEVLSGILQGSSGENTGSFYVAANATNQINGLELDTGTSFGGPGLHQLLGGGISGQSTNNGRLVLSSLYGPGALVNSWNSMLWLERGECNITNLGVVVCENERTTLSNLWNYARAELRSGVILGSLRNMSELRKTTSSTVVVSGRPLENQASLSIEEGILRCYGVFRNSGQVTVLSNSVFELWGSNVLFVGAIFTGPGISEIFYGTTVLPGPASGSNVMIAGSVVGSSAFITGAGDLVVASNGLLTLDVTDMAGPGALRVHAGGRVDVRGNGNFVNMTRPLYNQGDVTISRSYYAGDIENDGTIVFEAGESRGRLVNRGILRVPFGTSGSISAGGFVNLGHTVINGALTIADGSQAPVEYGEVTLNGGVLSVSRELTNTVIRGSGRVYQASDDFFSKVSINDAVSPGLPIGALEFNGLLLKPGARLEFDIAGDADGEWDHIEVGNLFFEEHVLVDVRLLNGFSPKIGDRFELMRFNTFGAGHGYDAWPKFPAFRGLTLPNGLRLAPVFSRTNLVLIAQEPVSSGANRLGFEVQFHTAWDPFLLRWPPELTGYYLQQTTNLGAPYWETIGTTGYLPNPSHSYDGRAPSLFFRLSDPENSDQ